MANFGVFLKDKKRGKEIMDIEGWNIDLAKLPGPHRNKKFLPLLQHLIFQAPSNNLACLIYSVSEI
jgi:hypothetical protein